MIGGALRTESRCYETSAEDQPGGAIKLPSLERSLRISGAFRN